MHRHELSDAQWAKVKDLLPVQPGPRSQRGDRPFVNAVMWRLKTGAPWRDIPERYGPWKTTYNRFARWVQTRRLGEGLQRASHRRRRRLSHRRHRGPGAPGCGRRKRGVRCNALGRSRGGFSSKLHAITTSQGKPLHIILTPGQQHDATEAENLIEHASGKALVADAGYDSDAIVGAVRQRGMKPVIAMNPTRKYNRRRKSRALYRLRGNIECFFHDIKRFRAVACRYEKTATNFLAAVHVACILVWLN